MNDEELDEHIGENIAAVAPFCSWWRPIDPVPWEDWIAVYTKNLRDAYRLGVADDKGHG